MHAGAMAASRKRTFWKDDCSENLAVFTQKIPQIAAIRLVLYGCFSSFYNSHYYLIFLFTLARRNCGATRRAYYSGSRGRDRVVADSVSNNRLSFIREVKTIRLRRGRRHDARPSRRVESDQQRRKPPGEARLAYRLRRPEINPEICLVLISIKAHRLSRRFGRYGFAVSETRHLPSNSRESEPAPSQAAIGSPRVGTISDADHGCTGGSAAFLLGCVNWAKHPK